MDAKVIKSNAKKNGDVKKSNRDDRQSDAKTEELAEKLLKSFGITASSDDKVFQLAKNHVEMEKESNRRASILKLSEKALEKEQREKDHLQKEYNKGVLIKDKLEQVCREQQKLMKSIKSESMSKIRDEEEKRKETQAHFQQSINEIFTTLGKNNDENLKIKEANLEMTKKFKFLAEQYELREKQLEKLNEQIKLETQLNEAKLAKVSMEATIEREILLKEKQVALEEILSTNKTVLEMQQREKALKEQLNLYISKYEEFQSSLKQSSGIFNSYKLEIEKMAKKIKTLERECYESRVKYEKCNKTLLEMATDKQKQDQYVAKSARQIAQLQKLCRTLQAERNVLGELLKTHNIERPNLPELPPEPKDIEPPPKTIDKLEVMSRNCDELKRTLAQLQGQMSVMTEKQKTETAAVPSNKKSKNKKSKSKSDAKSNATKTTLETNAIDDTVTPELESAPEPVTATAVANTNPQEADDKPLAELVTKVLAENPPPIELLESVLTSEVLADILSKEQVNVTNEDQQTIQTPDNVSSTEEASIENVNGVTDGDTVSETTVHDANASNEISA